MKFVTQIHAKVDRIACPWLILRFVEPTATFMYLPEEMVLAFAAEEKATPFAVAGAELGHHGELCTFDAIIEKYRLNDPALLDLAKIVRGADTQAMELAPEAAGLYAIATGFQALSPEKYDDDYALLDLELPLYDALYEYCRNRVQGVKVQTEN